MFVQIIKAPVSDRDACRDVLAYWKDELGAGATGWLGTTSGITDEGELFAAARFESAEAAKANSDRPEQGEFWERVEATLAGPATFYDCTDVEVRDGGGSDGAGFVQVIESRTDDPVAVKQAMDGMDDDGPSARPDVMGSVGVTAPDGLHWEIIYFTSEAEARVNEKKPRTPELQASMDAMMALMRDVRFLDLHEPWLYSPS